MTAKQQNLPSSELAELIVEGIREKKGLKITSMHLGLIKNAICEQFVICHGTSRTQVEAIADSVKEHVKKHLGVRPWRSEGYENAEWILIDYFDVVVHVFQQQTREHYKLEELWADAELKEYDAVD